jgi:hypothetical protein
MLEFLLAGAAAASAFGDWTVRDTTDNLTGERSVAALAISESIQGDEFSTISIWCVEDQPTLHINWKAALPKEYAVVSIDVVASDQTDPMLENQTVRRIWRVDPDVKTGEPGRTWMSIDSTQSLEIVELLSDPVTGGDLINIRVIGLSGPSDANFALTGIKAAYDRVRSYCR